MKTEISKRNEGGRLTEPELTPRKIIVPSYRSNGLNPNDGMAASGEFSPCEKCNDMFRDENLEEHKDCLYCHDCLQSVLEDED